MTTTLDLLEECRRLLWDRHDDDYAIDLRGRLEEHIARESAHGESAHIGWRVVTWNSATDREFLTRPEALDYITMNDTDGDWHMEPIMPSAPQPAPAVPNGWAMVPVELTEEMIVAAIAARKFAGGKRDLARNVHRDMLAAAPTPPKGE